MKKPIIQPRPPARMAQHRDEPSQQHPVWRQQLKQKLLCCWGGSDKNIGVDNIVPSRIPSKRAVPVRPRRPSEFELSERPRSRPDQQLEVDRTRPVSRPIIESPTARLVPNEQDGEVASTDYRASSPEHQWRRLRAEQLEEEHRSRNASAGSAAGLQPRGGTENVRGEARASTPVPRTATEVLASGDLKTLPSMRRRLAAQQQATGMDGGVDVRKAQDPADVVS